ncbi:MAG: hypothetical protein ABR548_04285 [Actinomycetota bacterium]|nr:hypothetical protein [Actinomycetota bacterium]
MSQRRLFLRGACGLAAGAVLWLGGTGFAVAGGIGSLPELPLPTILSSPSSSPASDPGVVVPSDAPLPMALPSIEPTGLVDDGGLLDIGNGGNIPIDPGALLPPGITDPGPLGGGGGGGGGGGNGGSGTGGNGGTTTTGGGGGTHGAGGTLRDPSAGTRIGPATVTRNQNSPGKIAGRARHIAPPFTVPAGIAAAGLIGLILMSRGSGKLGSLEEEKEALDGWTVIRL